MQQTYHDLLRQCKGYWTTKYGTSIDCNRNNKVHSYFSVDNLFSCGIKSSKLSSDIVIKNKYQSCRMRWMSGQGVKPILKNKSIKRLRRRRRGRKKGQNWRQSLCVFIRVRYQKGPIYRTPSRKWLYATQLPIFSRSSRLPAFLSSPYTAKGKQRAFLIIHVSLSISFCTWPFSFSKLFHNFLKH